MLWIIAFSCLISSSTQICYEKEGCETYCYNEECETTCRQLDCYHLDGSFESKRKIDNLHVYSSNLTNLRRGFLTNLPDLKRITMEGDNIANIEIGTFDNLPMLKEINLTNNNLTTLNSFFTTATNLTGLVLSNNKITEVRTDAFDWVRNGQLKLMLTSNRISNATFLTTNCQALSFLGLAYNSIDRFIYPNSCTYLEFLNISRNNMREFAVNVSNSMKLRFLGLSRNKLSYIDGDTFVHFEYLEALDLSYNPLFATNDIPANLFQNKPYLNHLDLSATGIKNLIVGTFTKLNHLLQLDLNHNNLTDLPKGIFHGLNMLRGLSLQENRLTSFEFDGSKSLEIVDLNGNLWQCDSLAGIIKKLTKVNVSIVHGNTHNSSNLYGISCSEKNEENAENALKLASNISLFLTIQESVRNLLKNQEDFYNKFQIIWQNMNEKDFKVHDDLKAILVQINDSKLIYKEKLETAELKEANSENSINGSNIAIVVGIYGILLFLIAVCIIQIIVVYGFRRQYWKDNEENNPLTTMQI